MYWPGLLFLLYITSASKFIFATVTIPSPLDELIGIASANDVIDEWLELYDQVAEQYLHEKAVYEWDYSLNMSERNAEVLDNSVTTFAGWSNERVLEARHLLSAATDGVDKMNIRQLERISASIITSDPSLARSIRDLESSMLAVYSKTTVNISGVDMSLEPGLVSLISTSRDCESLRQAWLLWYREVGKLIHPLYQKNVGLLNTLATENGFVDNGEMWRQESGMTDVEDLVANLWSEVEPLYRALHGYVKMRLWKVYPEEMARHSPYIPVHLVGDMWGQNWDNIMDILIPNEDDSDHDGGEEDVGSSEDDDTDSQVEEFLSQGTAYSMVKMAEDFYLSLGFPPVTREFWRYSVFEKDSRKMSCHAESMNMYAPGDVRLKICLTPSLHEFLILHHELGHIYYYYSYNYLPVPLRDGATAAMHEAIGDTMVLSVSTPLYLQQTFKLESHPRELNFLLRHALLKLPLLPYSLCLEKWRWGVFAGIITSDKYNEAWWRCREEIGGITRPRANEDGDDLADAACKYHAVSNQPYIRYFLSTFLQFQFHSHLCEVSGSLRSGDVSSCSIHGSEAAGDMLRSAMRLGASKDWRIPMRMLSGTDTVSAEPLLQYFRPLYEWLKRENR